MSRIVVLGAGLGGVQAAYELRDHLGKEHEVVVVSPYPDFHFTPSNPWVAVGWRSPEAISVPLQRPMEKRGIRLITQAARSIDAENSALELADGERLDYDYLVITTGPDLAFDAIEGLGPVNGHTHSICTRDHAAQAWEAYQRVLENPGPIVIGAVQGASCFGPAYEFAMIVDADLRKRKLRDRVPMTFVTSEPYVGHLGLGGVGDSKSLMEHELRERHIHWHVNTRVDKVEQGTMHCSQVNDEGEAVKSIELPFSFSMMLPSFRGVSAVASTEGLCNPKGFVEIDAHQRNPKYRNIFSAGVCVAIPPVEVTPLPVGAPKTGYMIESMVSAIVKNIEADLAGEPAEAQATWNAICLADLGDTGVAFVALPQIPPRNVTWAKQGKWVHWAKIAFEKYFMRKVRKGHAEPVYERYVLKALGIKRLRG
ncbi:NAD(P)/FAD-dependent oxidoreductase [Wenzhouxiangella marina]|uniref:Sulfide-quinone reductase n=1 Tax=Wenzhouxiangella marina TaxID=1579979 RepID=A0A0K0XSM3_9GAMM|nr:FAD/NAD(P)-binding oxidoreductase [Wenzhouxiangella marina]AKS40660.1 pyridine nucleotide-disulfide oxidoreductase [Wenzhouxiangella marina]MBB6088430.1 sulfide:quinone oxidoreductase [Wenzhouxiangella marina]